jgi:hypothetical protein
MSKPTDHYALTISSIIDAAREASTSAHVFQPRFDEYDFCNLESSGVPSPYFRPNGSRVLDEDLMDQ